MNILVLNPGSSSIKRAIYELPGGVRVDETGSIDAAGIRVVHGGSKFVAPVRVDEFVIAEIERLTELAPLHNPMALQAIRETQEAMPEVPIVAVFDTAFHQTMPPVAALYALPPDLGVRRHGFHGISYSYVSSRVHAKRHIVCHLGNGASVCAILDGRSVDTSMGFTPLEGLVMGTRAGDLDAGILLHLLRHGKTAAELDDLLNHRSGLLGVSGRSADVRELEEAARNDDEEAALALEMFAVRVAKYIGAYATVLGGVDVVTFTAGIGEHSAFLRSRICERLAFLGIVLDEDLNHAPRSDERRISTGAVDVWVIPTNEEWEIARLAFEALHLPGAADPAQEETGQSTENLRSRFGNPARAAGSRVDG